MLTQGGYAYSPAGVGIGFKSKNGKEGPHPALQAALHPASPGSRTLRRLRQHQRRALPRLRRHGERSRQGLPPARRSLRHEHAHPLVRPGASHNIVENTSRNTAPTSTKVRALQPRQRVVPLTKKEDFLWMGAFSLQAGYGIGREPFSYIYSKGLQPRRRDLTRGAQSVLGPAATTSLRGTAGPTRTDQTPPRPTKGTIIMALDANFQSPRHPRSPRCDPHEGQEHHVPRRLLARRNPEPLPRRGNARALHAHGYRSSEGQGPLHALLPALDPHPLLARKRHAPPGRLRHHRSRPDAQLLRREERIPGRQPARDVRIRRRHRHASPERRGSAGGSQRKSKATAARSSPAATATSRTRPKAFSTPTPAGAPSAISRM